MAQINLGPYTTNGGLCHIYKDGSFRWKEKSRWKTEETATHLWVETFNSNNQGRGYGTALFREVFKIALRSGDEGRVELEAAESSHFFWLKMGFMPREKQVFVWDYVSHELSMLKLLNMVIPLIKDGKLEIAIQKTDEEKLDKLRYEIFKATQNWQFLDPTYMQYEDITDEKLGQLKRDLRLCWYSDGKKLTESTDDTLLTEEASLRDYYCRQILNKLKPDLYPWVEKITKEQLALEQSYILELVDNPKSTVSYLQSDFINKTLISLSQGRSWPDTSRYGNIDMYLTPEAMERWKDDINGKKPFVPFRQFGQLQPFMTEAQLTFLKDFFLTDSF